jgi:hypothetical protein
VKSRFWTTFVAPKVAKGAERPKWAEWNEIFVVFELQSMKIGALFFVLNNSCLNINFQKINSYL